MVMRDEIGELCHRIAVALKTLVHVPHDARLHDLQIDPCEVLTEEDEERGKKPRPALTLVRKK